MADCGYGAGVADPNGNPGALGSCLNWRCDFLPDTFWRIVRRYGVIQGVFGGERWLVPRLLGKLASGQIV